MNMYERGVRSSSETNWQPATHRASASDSSAGALASRGTIAIVAAPPTAVPINRNTALDRTAPLKGWLVIYTVVIAQNGRSRPSEKETNSASIAAMKQFHEKIHSRKPKRGITPPPL